MITSFFSGEILISLTGDKFVPLNGQHENSTARDRKMIVTVFLMRFSNCTQQNVIFREAMNFNVEEEDAASIIREIDRRFPMLFAEIESLPLKSSFGR